MNYLENFYVNQIHFLCYSAPNSISCLLGLCTTGEYEPSQCTRISHSLRRGQTYTFGVALVWYASLFSRSSILSTMFRSNRTLTVICVDQHIFRSPYPSDHSLHLRRCAVFCIPGFHAPHLGPTLCMHFPPLHIPLDTSFTQHSVIRLRNEREMRKMKKNYLLRCAGRLNSLRAFG